MLCKNTEEFIAKYGFDPELLPDVSDEDIDELFGLCAIVYRKLCEDEKLDALEELWAMADEWPELKAVFRRVHEDPTFGLEPAL